MLKSKNWVLECHFVQLSKNTREHLGEGSNPYAFHYGQTCWWGITCFHVDIEVLKKQTLEEGMNIFLKSFKIMDAKSPVQNIQHQMMKFKPMRWFNQRSPSKLMAWFNRKRWQLIKLIFKPMCQSEMMRWLNPWFEPMRWFNWRRQSDPMRWLNPMRQSEERS